MAFDEEVLGVESFGIEGTLLDTLDATKSTGGVDNRDAASRVRDGSMIAMCNLASAASIVALRRIMQALSQGRSSGWPGGSGSQSSGVGDRPCRAAG